MFFKLLQALKKINETIDFLKKFDPNSTVVFQSDHNWSMSKNIEEKKMIYLSFYFGPVAQLVRAVHS